MAAVLDAFSVDRATACVVRLCVVRVETRRRAVGPSDFVVNLTSLRFVRKNRAPAGVSTV
jgi:hypothetical protein